MFHHFHMSVNCYVVCQYEEVRWQQSRLWVLKVGCEKILAAGVPVWFVFWADWQGCHKTQILPKRSTLMCQSVLQKGQSCKHLSSWLTSYKLCAHIKWWWQFLKSVQSPQMWLHSDRQSPQSLLAKHPCQLTLMKVLMRRRRPFLIFNVPIASWMNYVVTYPKKVWQAALGYEVIGWGHMG